MAKKDLVEHLEYRGGYSLVQEDQIFEIIEAYKEGRVRKNALRVFAARLEQNSLHPKSRVDLKRILNCKAASKGIKRLRSGEITGALEQVAEVERRPPDARKRLRAVSRIALRAIAQGRLSCAEAVVLLMYSVRRISQRKPLRRLLPQERYARFTYGELSALSGIPKANICRAVKRLRSAGFLNTVWVVRQNVNQFGLLFIDGPVLSLVPGAAVPRGKPCPKKTTTPSTRIDNTPMLKLPTLKNSDPKILNEEGKAGLLSVEKMEGRGFSAEWYRILARANAMKANETEQAA